MKKPEFYFDENLRARPLVREDLLDYILFLEASLKDAIAATERVKMMGELGVHLRTADRFVEAEQMLEAALRLVREENLGIATEVQQKIRLAHVYQEQKKFHESDEMFLDCLRVCESERLTHFHPFALQHHGKNLFDQKRYAEALNYFEQALQARLQNKVPQDQIESSELAIRTTKKRLASAAPQS